MKYEKLFSEGKIGNVILKNRLVMSAMGSGLAELDGSPTNEMIAFYETRAAGGAGLIIPEITRISDENGAGLMRQLSVTKDRHIEPLSRLAEAVHKHDSKIFIQLHHPGRETMAILQGEEHLVAPSAIPCKVSQEETRALSTEEVKEIIQKFVDGARRVQASGCDGVELHGAHGYLINQFLSPYSNKRTDEYGGNFENRFRFVKEIIEGIKKTCPGFPIIARITVDEFLDQVGVTEDYIHLADGVKIAKELEKIGVDAIDVSCGVYETFSNIIEPISYPVGWRQDMVKAVKKAVNIPVIAVSVIREPEMAESFLAAGDAQDFISMGRPWLADSDWGKKVKEGREKELRRCMSCLRCFETLESLNAVGLPPECSMNPNLANELRDGELPHDAQGRSAVVVGAGPAGMCAAITLAKRGAKVTLLEKGESLGGTVNLAKMPPHKERLQWLMEYYESELERLGVEVKLNTEATAEMISQMNPDGTIVATGGTSIVPGKIPGIKGDHVYTIEDVLAGQSGLKDKNVVVIGAGMSGIETAEYLCAEGNNVTVVDMLDTVAPNAYKVNVMDVMSRLQKNDTNFLLSHALKEIRDNTVVLEKLEDHSEVVIDADAVVLSLGFIPNNQLVKDLSEKGIEARVIGTAVCDSPIAPATRSGYEAGRNLFVPASSNTFHLPPEKMNNFFVNRVMNNQKGVYLTFLTDPEALRKVLPPALTPFSLPIVSLSVAHVQNPTFTEEYYEAILGCYAMHGETVGLYTFSLILGGPGCEMAMHTGRECLGIPKKLGGEFSFERDGDNIHVTVGRKGTCLADIKMKLGEYNSPLANLAFNGAVAGVKVAANGIYCMIDQDYNENHEHYFNKARFYTNLCEYDYKKWDPAFTKLELTSSVDDPWAVLPINTIIGGAYSENNLFLGELTHICDANAEETAPYLMKGRFDETVFCPLEEK